MSDTYPVTAASPLGHSPKVLSTFLGSATVPAAPVVVKVFDGGRLIAASIATSPATVTAQVSLVLIDPNTLATISKLALPTETATFKGKFRPAGAGFYLDQSGRILVGAAESTVWAVSHTLTGFSHDNTYDLTSVIPKGDSIQALQPDFSGHIFFTSKGGVVGTLNSTTGALLGSIELPGEEIDNSSASDETGGLYIASNQAMYRFDADSTGKPAVTWREPYDAGKHIKSGPHGLRLRHHHRQRRAEHARPRLSPRKNRNRRSPLLLRARLSTRRQLHRELARRYGLLHRGRE